MQPHRLSFPLDHLHVSENRNEPWLLAEPLVDLDTNACAYLAETVPHESEDDARTLCCEWDEHGERFKPFRKIVLESKTHLWNHGRIEAAPTCLHICRAMEKAGEQSTAVAGTFSERHTSVVRTGLLTSSVVCVTCSRKRRVLISSIWEPWLVWKSQQGD